MDNILCMYNPAVNVPKKNTQKPIKLLSQVVAVRIQRSLPADVRKLPLINWMMKRLQQFNAASDRKKMVNLWVRKLVKLIAVKEMYRKVPSSL